MWQIPTSQPGGVNTTVPRGFWPFLPTAKSGRGLNEIIPGARQVLDEVMKRREVKGLSQKLLRMMIVGIPNVGKSSLINKLAGSKRAKVEDRPGVTRGKQWVSIGGGVELLDMPGVLWPKFDDKEVGEKLAYIGSIKDEILDIEHLAMRFLQTVAENYPKLLCAATTSPPRRSRARMALICWSWWAASAECCSPAA